jgi:hypothetical protein
VLTSINADGLTIADHGAQLFRSAALDDLSGLLAALADLPAEQAGVRISGLPGLRPYLAPGGSIGAVASRALGAEGRPVRAILFDKSEAANWSLAWHQDRTICVRKRVEVDGFGPWSVKAGLHHVAPPFDLLARMVTLRVHLDDVPATNAPLLIAPGSHRHGRVMGAGAAYWHARSRCRRCQQPRHEPEGRHRTNPQASLALRQ